MKLSKYDSHLLSGAGGKASQFAMEVIVNTAKICKAEKLIDVSMAHVDSCFYSGQVGVDFSDFLLSEGGKVAVPTMTNVGLIDLLHPDLRPETANPEEVKGAKRLMATYEKLGCEVVWTCAPYQLKQRPKFGDQIIGSESNAVAFYNSVLGARTNKYGDFLDICGAITGRVPYSGLHVNSNRRGEILFRLDQVPDQLKNEDVFYHVLGIIIGKLSGTSIPVIDGLPNTVTEDQLKAISAAGAASGSVNLFHIVGVTPEASTLNKAFQNEQPKKEIDITPQLLIKARDKLSMLGDQNLGAVCLGTPHFSTTEFENLMPLLNGRHISPKINFYISTSRFVLAQIQTKGWLQIIEQAGIKMIVDTCTYFTPSIKGIEGRVMTNSGKWAYYAPGMLDVDVSFGSMEECVESAMRGHLWRDKNLWDPDFWGAGDK